VDDVMAECLSMSQAEVNAEEIQGFCSQADPAAMIVQRE
jgi:hypothetical protein